MLVIFSFSADSHSSQHSSRFIGPFLRWLKPDLSEAAVERAVFAVRKTAHATEYAVLALLLWRARRQPRRPDPWPWRWSEAGFAWTVAAIFAATDEWHQSFVPNREARVGDVLIDAGGAALGLLALRLLGRWRKWW